MFKLTPTEFALMEFLWGFLFFYIQVFKIKLLNHKCLCEPITGGTTFLIRSSPSGAPILEEENEEKEKEVILFRRLALDYSVSFCFVNSRSIVSYFEMLKLPIEMFSLKYILTGNSGTALSFSTMSSFYVFQNYFLVVM